MRYIMLAVCAVSILAAMGPSQASDDDAAGYVPGPTDLRVYDARVRSRRVDDPRGART